MAVTQPPSRPGRGARVVGEQRSQLGADLARRYEDGESIRALAIDLGRSYGWVQTVLKEAGAVLRTRGGDTRSPAARERIPSSVRPVPVPPVAPEVAAQKVVDADAATLPPQESAKPTKAKSSKKADKNKQGGKPDKKKPDKSPAGKASSAKASSAKDKKTEKSTSGKAKSTADNKKPGKKNGRDKRK